MANERLFEEMNIWRGYFIKTVKNLSEDQWTKIPEGFTNNILWNAGHVVWCQAAFIYDMSGVPSPLPENYPALFKNGTSPSDWESTPDIEELLKHMAEIGPQIEADYAAGKFKERQPFNQGFKIDTFEEAMNFNAWHEGIHLGTVTSLMKLV